MSKAIGRIHRVRIHNMNNMTGALLRFEIEHRPWPRGGVNYPKATWGRDHVLMELNDLLQEWLTLHAGMVDGIPATLLPELERMIRKALVDLRLETRSRRLDQPRRAPNLYWRLTRTGPFRLISRHTFIFPLSQRTDKQYSRSAMPLVSTYQDSNSRPCQAYLVSCISHQEYASASRYQQVR